MHQLLTRGGEAQIMTRTTCKSFVQIHSNFSTAALLPLLTSRPRIINKNKDASGHQEPLLAQKKKKNVPTPKKELKQTIKTI